MKTISAVEQYPAMVANKDQSHRYVKNLGWLLSHWREVNHFTLRTTIKGNEIDGVLMVAWMKDASRIESYSCGWAGDLEHVKNWLNRPVFRGVPVDVNPQGDASKLHRN